MQTCSRFCAKRLAAACTFSVLSVLLCAAPALLCPAHAVSPVLLIKDRQEPVRTANFDGEWNLRLSCAPFGQRKTLWVLTKTVTVKNNRAEYSITSDSFIAKGLLVFRDGQVAIDHVATKSDDALTFWAVKVGAKPIDADLFTVSTVAKSAGHDAGEAKCLVSVARTHMNSGR